MSPYRRYRRLLVLNPILLLLYAVVALSDVWLPQIPRHPSGEIFPFASWNLFSTPRVKAKLYTVRITKVRDDRAAAASLVDRTIRRPRALRPLRHERFQKTARALTHAIWGKRSDEVERLQAQLANFLRPLGVTEYELVVLTYQPIDFYRDDRVAREEVIARFVVRP